jgi:enoyl-CoA hydratase/carnithine racemase
MVNRAASTDLANALDVEAFSQAIAITGSEHREGLAAFFEKRTPKY